MKRILLIVMMVCWAAAASAYAPWLISGGVFGAPIVTNGSFSASPLPLTNGQTIGTMTASNSPTSWSITSCSSSCTGYFAISSSGVITVTSTGASGATATTYTLNVQASNLAGNGSGTATIAVRASGSVAFTPLHTYFLDPVSGVDANNGLTTTTAWKTPNHSVVCGDVIIAKSASYGPETSWGAVSGCPSTSGGIDGAGGINFASLVCAGTLNTCNLAGAGGDGFNVSANNWAVEGFNISAPGSGRAMAAVVTGSTALHHVAFVNNVVTNSGYAFLTGPAGGTSSTDYIAAVGNIGQNSNAYTGGSSFCGGAFDVNAPKNYDTNSGTHIAIWGNYMMNNVGPSPQTDCTSDMEAVNLDTLGGQSYTQQIVAKDNLIWKTGGYGFQLFYNTSAATAIPIVIDHNTTYGSCNPWISGVFNCAEINVATGSSSPWLITITNNLIRTAAATCCGTTPVYALAYSEEPNSLAANFTVSGNYFWGTSTNCESSSSTTCAPSSSQAIAINCCSTNPALPPPTSTYTDPAYANTADLTTNWLGAPTCSGYTNVAACMGWNFGTQTSNTLTPIADLTATASGTSGVGYRPPAACAADAAYPTWLKGINYLQVVGGFVNGATLTENAGLTNLPCNL